MERLAVRPRYFLGSQYLTWSLKRFHMLREEYPSPRTFLRKVVRLKTKTKYITSMLICFCLLLFTCVCLGLLPDNFGPSSLGHISHLNVDMNNTYHPFVDFRFVFPDIEPDLRKDVDTFLIVLVNSAASGDTNARCRDTIRHTWASHSSCDQSRLSATHVLSELQWSVVFVLGKGAKSEDERRNEKEAVIHKDMLVGDIPDNYLNNIIKLYMALLWVTTSTSAKYILKTDDDVFVRVPRVLQHIARKSFPARYYGGFTYTKLESRQVDRNPKGKWAISWKYFNETIFPAFNPGAFIVLSLDLLPRLFRYTAVRRPFHTDDAYIAIAMRDLNVTVNKIDSFLVMQHLIHLDNYTLFLQNKSDCELWEYDAIGHDIQPTTVKYLYNRVERLCRRNVSRNCSKIKNNVRWRPIQAPPCNNSPACKHSPGSAKFPDKAPDIG